MTDAPAESWDDLERLLLDALERPDAERAAALDELCAQHPAQAAALRQRFALLDELGFVGAVVRRALAPGDQLGDYRLVRRLGGGAMGVVYLAEQKATRRQVALKVLRPELLDEPRARERFRRELEAAARIEHPGICPVYDAGEADGQPYIAMRYVAGESLAEAIARTRRSGDGSSSVVLATGEAAAGAAQESDRIRAAVALVEAAARALEVAHAQGLVHRDVKPGNILVTPKGEPVLVDFGLARDDGTPGTAAEATLTASTDRLGTPAYMAPEQIEPRGQRPDARADVYALGAVLYECLTLHAPYEAPGREALYRQILTASPPDPRQWNERVPRDVAIVLQKALEKDPARRYATALEFADDLRRVRAHEPIRARPASRWLRTRRWTQRNPVLAGALAATFLCLVAGLAVSLSLLWRVERTLAERQARDLAVRARQALDDDTTHSVLLAREALRVERSEPAASALYAAAAELREQTVHEIDDPYTVAAPQDGSYFVVGSYRTNQAWIHRPGATPVELQTSRSGHRVLHRIKVSRDGGRILVISLGEAGHEPSGLATVWTPEDPERPRARLRHPDSVFSGCFTGDGSVLTGCADGVARLWPPDSSEPRHLLRGHQGTVSCCAASPPTLAHDDELLLTGSHDCTVRIWSARDGHEIRTIPHGGWLVAVDFAPQGDRFLTATGFDLMRSWLDDPGFTDDRARLFDRHGNLLDELALHRAGLVTARFSPDGRHVLTTSQDQTARLWPIGRDGRAGPSLVLPHDGAAYAGAFDATGERIATGSRTGTCYLWNLRGECTATLRGHYHGILELCFTQQGLVTVDYLRSLRIWSTESRLVPTWRHAGLVAWATYARRGEWIIVAERHGRVHVAKRGEPSAPAVSTFDTGIRNVLSIDCSPDGEHAVVADESGGLHVFRLRDGGRVLAMPKAHERRIPRAQLSPVDGQRILSGSQDGFLRLWSLDGKLLAEAKPPPRSSQPIWALALSPDGRRCAVAVDNGQKHVRIHRLPDPASTSGECPEDGPPLAHDENVRRLAFSGNGERLVSATVLGSIWLWDLPSRRRRILQQAPRDAAAVAISPDGETIASGLQDGTVHLLRADGSPIAVLPGRGRGRIRSLEFLADGSRLLVAAEGGTVSEWVTDPGELLSLIEASRSIAKAR